MPRHVGLTTIQVPPPTRVPPQFSERRNGYSIVYGEPKRTKTSLRPLTVAHASREDRKPYVNAIDRLRHCPADNGATFGTGGPEEPWKHVLGPRASKKNEDTSVPGQPGTGIMSQVLVTTDT